MPESTAKAGKKKQKPFLSETKKTPVLLLMKKENIKRE